MTRPATEPVKPEFIAYVGWWELRLGEGSLEACAEAIRKAWPGLSERQRASTQLIRPEHVDVDNADGLTFDERARVWDELLGDLTVKL